MDANWSAIARSALVGLLLPVAIGLAGGAAADETAAGAQMAATPPAERPLALDPEKDTIALEPRQGVTPTANGLAVRRDDASLAGSVRVGQGLRPDGTELVPSEVSRPWLIRQ
ncbi:hypothetical protein FZ983_29755 [Azospirillum sp. B21]|uniref:hypothetical protein n=1 Tax=Azospirillum sp. B21 TaxID=2607496 RepID=UPI0011EEF0B8|nr:hypothetical protein [Azospirillum sp. B21]KAA0573521.1 hypothetical protein FZ983_29755 [Azospirillum sp. B21]